MAGRGGNPGVVGDRDHGQRIRLLRTVHAIHRAVLRRRAGGVVDGERGGG